MRAVLLATALLGSAACLGTAQPALAEPASAPGLRAGALGAFDAKIARTKDVMMGDPPAARQAALEALKLAEALANDSSVAARDAMIAKATALWLLGEANIFLNDAARAKAAIADALAAVERADPGSKLNGDLLRSRATLAETGGNVQGALKDYMAAYRIFRARGEARAQAMALQDIGNLYLEAQDYARVRSYYSQSHDAYASDPWLNLATYNNRGEAYRGEKRFAEAENEYKLALTAARELKSPLLQARILTNLADTQADVGKLEQASRTLVSADALVADGEGAGWRPFVLGVRARIAAKRGDDAGAGRLLTQSFAGQDLTKTEMPFRDLHRTASEVYERLGQRDMALAHLKAYQRLDREGLRLTASMGAQLMAAQVDFANQDLRISQLKQGQLQRDVTIERQKNQFRTRLFIGLGSALLVIFGLLFFGYFSIRRSRDQVRQANTELSQTNFDLEAALKARTDFLATTSHEIRTPLNGILGMAQVLLADRRLVSDVRERIQLLMGAGQTMKTLVDDILDVAKMEAGELTVQANEVNLSRLIADCVGLWREAAANKGVALECVLDNVPARVATDGDRLKQIVSNLLSNAVKFTNEGSVTLEVRGGARDGETVVDFAVRDTGIGIEEADQARIFEAFTQANSSTTRKYSGTGLGLAISQRLAKALGGAIRLESAPGKGSCFTLSLPLAAVGTGLAQLTANADSLSNARVLVLDRNLGNHALMRMLLAPVTLSADIAFTVEDAQARLDAGEVDHLVIEGASAPIEVIRELAASATAAGVRTTLLAAPTEELPSAAIFSAGVGQVLLKPIGTGDLIAGLRRSYEEPDEVLLDAAE
jgi:signal transduction histidine kinase